MNKITPKRLALGIPGILLVIAAAVTDIAGYSPHVEDKLETASEYSAVPR